MIWKARSIWLTGAEEGAGVFVYLRRRFRLGDRPRVASAFAAASVPYRLFVNGAVVARGPATAPPGVRYFESFDIARYLQRGVNVIAAQCRPQASPGGASSAGFQLQAAIERQGDTPIAILSDETWMALRRAARPGGGDGESWSWEDTLAGWLHPEFEDGGWLPAETLAVEPPAPFARPLPPLDEQWLAPVSAWAEAPEVEALALLAASPEPTQAGAKGATLLLPESPALSAEARGAMPGDRKLPQDPGSVPEAYPAKTGPSRDREGPVPGHGPDRHRGPPGTGPRRCPLRGQNAAPPPHGRGSAAEGPPLHALVPGERRVYDFGRHVAGYPRLTLSHAHDGVLEACYGDAFDAEGQVRSGGPTGADRWELAPVEAPRELETFGPRSFRYLQISLRDASTAVELDSVGLQQAHYPWPRGGRFECSDATLTRIWALGRDTLAAGVRDSFLADPGQVGPGWLGEARLQALVEAAAFGDGRLARKALVETAPMEDTHHPVLDESASWIFMLWEYLLQTGDRKLLQQLYPAARARLSLLHDYMDETGLLNVEAGRGARATVWVDDVALDRRAAVTAANAFHHRALLTAARLAASMADMPAQREYEHRARALRTAANWRLWSASDRAYVDCRTRDGLGRRIGAETNWLAVAFGLAEPARAAALGHWLDRWGEWRPEPSPFFQGYVLEALYALGADATAIARIRRLWGPFLDAGATTCWQRWPLAGEGEKGRRGEGEKGQAELLSTDPRRGSPSPSPLLPFSPSSATPHGAACWPPAAAPTHFLTRELLGVRPLAPGWARARIRPVLGDVAWVRGVAPSPLGDVTVECRRRAERAVDLLASIPAGMRVEIGLADVRERDVVEWEGRVIWPAPMAHRGLELEHTPRWSRDGWTWVVSGPREVRLRVRD